MRFGHRDAKQDELAQAIKDAYFEKDLRLLPEGLETMVGEKVWRCQADKNSEYPLHVLY